MWGDREVSDLKAEVVVLRAEIAQVRIELEREKSARLEDKLVVYEKMASIHEDLAGTVAGLRGKREKGPLVFRNARDFAQAVEKEEGVG